MEFVSDPPKMCSVDCIYICIYDIYIYVCMVSNMKIHLDDPHWGPNRPKTWIAGSTSLCESDLAGDGDILGYFLGFLWAPQQIVGLVLFYWITDQNRPIIVGCLNLFYSFVIALLVRPRSFLVSLDPACDQLSSVQVSPAGWWLDYRGFWITLW